LYINKAQIAKSVTVDPGGCGNMKKLATAAVVVVVTVFASVLIWKYNVEI
jgi:hypothetical protein